MASNLDLQCINTLRFLSVDMIQQAGSGHPGLPLGAATMAYALWSQQLKHHPANSLWPDRDRCVLSAGHGGALLYSLLPVTGYDLSLDELKRFRQWGSQASGHTPVDHCTWALVSEGGLMEGVAAEAASLAGHLQLGKLVCLYDDRRVTLSAGTDITFSEDRVLRFEACGWQTLVVEDGNDLDA